MWAARVSTSGATESWSHATKSPKGRPCPRLLPTNNGLGATHPSRRALHGHVAHTSEPPSIFVTVSLPTRAEPGFGIAKCVVPNGAEEADDDDDGDEVLVEVLALVLAPSDVLVEEDDSTSKPGMSTRSISSGRAKGSRHSASASSTPSASELSAPDFAASESEQSPSS